ncbi:Unknown protein [Striga hermonthica]|uniref:Ubiquitin-like protease family profile domain-containing protein n=1 Tax=Striga hermonthica TaxID=68872 RepID=A0A9N7MQ98_STRHE|nr:Unknown protein [Striga hermonthica]
MIEDSVINDFLVGIEATAMKEKQDYITQHGSDKTAEVGIEASVDAMKDKPDSITHHESDKPVGEPDSNVVMSTVDDDDAFPEITTQFLAEVDRTAQEKINSALKERNEHLDVLFYYLRKIGLYGKNAPVRFTTTDTLFDQHIKALYSTFLEQSRNPGVCSVQDMIIDYILGYKIISGLSWFEVDHVLFPMHVELNGIGHWILGRFSFADMRFWIYNSYQSVDFDKVVLVSAHAYSELLPIFLRLVHFFDKRTNVNTDAGGRIKTDVNSPLEITVASNIPKQINSDCGVFVVSYVEHFITDVDLPDKYDINVERLRYSYLLYAHGIFKKENDYESEDESPGTMPEEVRISYLE